eukprot:gnl/Trimastix_PCT/1737.p1 GENE.gnl/Trimastix_PCT/1737~~gnl/Trimastix_PCT/1737.p1  ORF type:complete len:291 (-),score=87.16 gnl/Trimastix_PCT/1737:297-1169(-)
MYHLKYSNQHDLSVFELPAEHIDNSIPGKVYAFMTKKLFQPNVEIEAKIGKLHSRNGPMDIPVTSEAIVDQSGGYFFRPGIPEEVFYYVLDQMKQRMAPQEQSIEDKFYKLGHETIRVSNDQHAIRKMGMEHMTVYCPGMGFDFRVSACQELPVEQLPQGPMHHSRVKQRWSFPLDPFTLDFTHVSTHGYDGRPEETYEIELEIMNVEALRREYELHCQQQPNRYFTLVQSFLSSARILKQYVESVAAAPHAQGHGHAQGQSGYSSAPEQDYSHQYAFSYGTEPSSRSPI